MKEEFLMKGFIRLLNKNFGRGDTWATLTYSKERVPENAEQAKVNMDNFILKLEGWMKEKKVKGILSYAHAISFNGERTHHHMITNFRDREVLESLWSGGGRTSARRLNEELGHEELVRYMLKRGADEIILHATKKSALLESQSRISSLILPDSDANKEEV